MPSLKHFFPGSLMVTGRQMIPNVIVYCFSHRNIGSIYKFTYGVVNGMFFSTEPSMHGKPRSTTVHAASESLPCGNLAVQGPHERTVIELH